jgi:transposase-like protein
MAKQPATPPQDVPPSRRRWSSSDKVRILEEAMAPGATVLGVARKYGVSAVSIYAWRKSLMGDAIGHETAEPASGRVPLSERRIHSERSRPQGGLLFSYGDVLSSGARRPAGAAEDDVVRGLERRVAELEARCRTLQGHIDAWEASRRNLGDVLRTIGSQLNLLAHFSEADHGRGEPEGA